ncbi:nucleoside hydrolase-like domain-containing protein [Microbacterium sp. NPDC056569]|uniref:nucleoside hydrolase-like domain-containing protein n=1 Tax=Microbacterium sp. NPDC056569 TaxID=3345867 RepID=UPI003671C648
MTADAPTPRPRTIVTADPELDDLNSMIRLLLYSNEIEIAGLVYASSRYHWRGDGRGTTFFLPDREYSTPQTSWRWVEGERFIDDVIDAYAVDYRNLVVHDPRYPKPTALRELVREGNVEFEGDASAETPGSNLIAETLLDERDDPLHIQLWAGPSTLARALMSIEECFASGPSWDEIHRRVSEKAIVTKFASQDATYDDYIRMRWPDIRVTDVASFAWGYGARRVVRDIDAHLLSADWIARNVLETGALGALYRVWGDGRQMVPGDTTDFFHLSGMTREQLVSLGYNVWMDPRPAGEWISEGDTTNTLNLVVPALRGHEHPSFGGWGGRAVLADDGASWRVRDVDDDVAGSRGEGSVTRWFADAQADFAARLQWTVHPEWGGANHHPILRIVEGVTLSAAAGERLVLHADATDPDGDKVELRWWEYREAGTIAAAALDVDGDSTAVVVPLEAQPGDTIHIVVEARDDARFPLVAYQRVIITVTDPN